MIFNLSHFPCFSVFIRNRNMVTVDYFLSAAESIRAKDDSRSFASLFGVRVSLCPIIFQHCQLYMIHGLEAKHILWGLICMKVYATEDAACSMLTRVTRKAYRRWYWIVIQAITSKISLVVSPFCDVFLRYTLDSLLLFFTHVHTSDSSSKSFLTGQGVSM
jgi:hypothetical protein